MSNTQKLASITLIGYTLFLAYLMLFGFSRYTNAHYMYNLIPFATIKQFLQIEQYNTGTWVINLLGNIGVFVPFGLLLPAVGVKKALNAYGLFLMGLIALELTQLISRRGSLDVDDLILNSLGYWIGYSLYCISKRRKTNVGNNNDLLS